MGACTVHYLEGRKKGRLFFSKTHQLIMASSYMRVGVVVFFWKFSFGGTVLVLLGSAEPVRALIRLRLGLARSFVKYFNTFVVSLMLQV